MSLVTSIFSGIQGSNAAHDAADKASTGQKAAGETLKQAGTDASGAVSTAVSGAQKGVVDAGNTSIDRQLAAGADAQQRALDAGGRAGSGSRDAAAAAATGLDPYATTGAAAAYKLGDLIKTPPPTAADIMKNDPGYNFTLQQGQLAIRRAQAAAGLTGSGGEAIAASQYAQSAAKNGYQPAFDDTLRQQQQQYDQLRGLSQDGQTAAQSQGNFRVNGEQFADSADINANQYAGNAGMATAAGAGETGVGAAEYAGNAGLQGGLTLADIGLRTGQGVAGTQIGAANAMAQGDLDAANAWNGMLNGIGNSVGGAVKLGKGLSLYA